MREITVQYEDNKNVTEPTQGYEDDFAYDLYASEGRLVPPLTFKSVIIPTDFKIAFDPIEAGLKVALRSGVAANTPLLLSNAPGIIEGTYRKGIGILVRNSFIDNSLVDFVFNAKGERVPLSEVPNVVKKLAKKAFEDEQEHLGHTVPLNSDVQKALFTTKVPRGTVYIAKDTRIAQMYMSPKYAVKFERSKTLPETDRGEKGIGSSGTDKK